MKHLSTQLFALGLISLVLASCASTKDTVLPQDGPSMKAIYEDHVSEMNARDPKVVRGELGNRPIATGEAAYGANIRTNRMILFSDNITENLFVQ
jgi:hypothetical protein